MEITTALAIDSKTLNLLTIGEPAVILLGGKFSNNPDDEEGLTEALCQPVSAYAVKEFTGEKIVIPLKRTENGDIQVYFEDSTSKVFECYQLVVIYKGQQILGSPFRLQFVDFDKAVAENQRGSLIDAQHKANIVLPLKMGQDIEMEVEGPCGSCDASVFQWPNQASSVSFIPPAAGEYTLHLNTHDDLNERLSYSMFADFSSEEAQQCYIMDSDHHLFEDPIPFKNQGQVFRVVTNSAEARLRGETTRQEKITVICHGPGEMTVQIDKDVDFPGTESCTVTPSMPGEYTLSILWNRRHIRNSPIKMMFSPTQSNFIAYEGEELDKVEFKVGEPYVFNVSCPSTCSEGLEVLCSPTSAAVIHLDPLNEDMSSYKCEVSPLKEGKQEISIKHQGQHVDGSPFNVFFKDVANAQLCKVAEVARDTEKKGYINVAISTEEAGPGIMEVEVQVIAKNGVTSKESSEVTTLKQDSTRHELQFHLGDGVACLLHALYNGRHIDGSPYKLVLADIGKVRVSGRGLLAGRVGEWNTFAVETTGSETLEMEPQITVVSETGDIADIEVLSSNEFSSASLESLVSFSVNSYVVKYRPTTFGKYKIDVTWGYLPVPGSPFEVNCYSHGLEVLRPPEKLFLGSTIEFNIASCSDSQIDISELELDAKRNKTENLAGKITGPLSEANCNVFKCTLRPEVTGKYVVGIKWKNLHIRGSPFCVKVLEPPKPENVVVRGAGVQNGVVGKQEFSVDTVAAGTGSLTISVSGSLPGGGRKKIPLKVSQDIENRRMLHVSYHTDTAGEYDIDVLWAGDHVPGSPYKIEHLHPGVKETTVVAVVCHSNGDSMGIDQCAVRDEYHLVLKKVHELEVCSIGTAVSNEPHPIVQHSEPVDGLPLLLSGGVSCSVTIKVD